MTETVSLDEIIGQRDELLAALKRLLEVYYHAGINSPTIEQARKAVARAEERRADANSRG